MYNHLLTGSDVVFAMLLAVTVIVIWLDARPREHDTLTYFRIGAAGAPTYRALMHPASLRTRVADDCLQRLLKSPEGF